MNYSRSKTRSFFGMISDRMADSLETVLVIGDVTRDIDQFYVHAKDRDGYPVYTLQEEQRRLGCAKAIADMIEGLGGRASVATDFTAASVKKRIIVDGKVLCRIDKDKVSNPPLDLPPAKLVLLADYAKGVLDERTMARIATKYAGREIIADWHPSRPLSFYKCATALKSSWRAPPPPDRPFIRTRGKDGLSLYLDGSIVGHWPALNEHPLDCCGAGDMVLAALGYGRLQGWDWSECCQFASEKAAQVCGNWGSVYATGDSASSREFRPAASGAHPAPAIS